DLTGGHPLPSEATTLADHPGARALAQLHWPTEARIALLLLLLREHDDPSFTAPPSLTPTELHTHLTQALTGPAIHPPPPPTPLSAIRHALDTVDDRLLTLLTSLGAEACATDPGLPLMLLPRLAQFTPLTAPERRLLTLHLTTSD